MDTAFVEQAVFSTVCNLGIWIDTTKKGLHKDHLEPAHLPPSSVYLGRHSLDKIFPLLILYTVSNQVYTGAISVVTVIEAEIMNQGIFLISAN